MRCPSPITATPSGAYRPARAYDDKVAHVNAREMRVGGSAILAVA